MENNIPIVRAQLIACSVLMLIALALPSGLLADTCQTQPPRSIIDATMNRDFKVARTLLKAWQKHSPSLSDGLFYSATIDMAEAKTQRKEGFKKFNASAMEKLKRVENQLKSRSGLSDQQTLTLGMTEAFIARLNLNDEEWLDAYKIGRRARDRLRALLQRAPHMQDAKLVLGLYEFYSGDIPVALKWLSYLVDLSGDRKKGIALLESSVKLAATASPEAARTLLDELELDAPEVCQWLPLNEQLRDSYPNNPRFAWRLQRHYRDCGFPQKALEENKRATRQFAGFSSTRKYLLADRGTIYRDLGDIEGLKSLSHVTPRLKNFDTLMREARYVNGDRSEKKYTPPPNIKNANPLALHKVCNG